MAAVRLVPLHGTVPIRPPLGCTVRNRLFQSSGDQQDIVGAGVVSHESDANDLVLQCAESAADLDLKLLSEVRDQFLSAQVGWDLDCC